MTNFLVGLVVGLSLATMVVIIWAPWRTVRDEPPLDENVESRIMLGEDPEKIARDLEASRARQRTEKDWNTEQLEALRELDEPGSTPESG